MLETAMRKMFEKLGCPVDRVWLTTDEWGYKVCYSNSNFNENWRYLRTYDLDDAIQKIIEEAA